MNALHSRIEEFVAETGVAAQGATVVPLTGDASDRRYVRLISRGGLSQVLAVYPGAFDFYQLPFANVARLLEAMPIPIPRILAHSGRLGIVALQDLGDVTLQAHLGAAPPDEHTALYRRAVHFIDVIQRRGVELASEAYLPYTVAFDAGKLTWELDFFVKHFLEAYRGVVLRESGRRALRGRLCELAEEIAAEPRVLCHRDYHSRNLMVHGQELYVIDFQDARMGPDTYDLVSLLRDSYVDLGDEQVDALIAFYLELRAAAGGSRPGAGAFRQRFGVMALQRTMKALGTFGFQTTSRGNPVYIQYIPRTLAHLRAELERQTRFDRLRVVLAEHLEELR
jgi:hypothetical protein